MAGPHVAGVVALMISANPDLAGQVDLIESIIESTARPKMTEQECNGVNGSAPVNNTYGYGVVDALAAVQAALMVTSTHELPTPPDEQVVVCYPNPVETDLHLMSSTVKEVDDLRLFTIDGQLILSKQHLVLPARVDVSAFPRGLYVVSADYYKPMLINVIRP